MSPVRMHFCTLVALVYGASSRAVRYGMNGTMPATVNSRDGSLETREAEGTAVWPLLTKKSIQRLVISCDFITWFLTLQYSLCVCSQRLCSLRLCSLRLCSLRLGFARLRG